ncbi:response regulator transcription factor [Paenibacillus sp. GCM10012307]|uniref:Heme response regulator HssR n=1 Tax=Paenibacillus roseus TaxID=2798579 RepID=A0A934MQ19_9BACL|nr:response regulator transcription factor [Paenibacillus roseus]MBJ6362681.1 response regulator transcription factor [Paenibacillus roseus]
MTTVLVVDDEAHIRELVRLYLQDEGMDIVEKANGEEAWEYINSHPVDLVILDVMMPKMDGWELCRRLRDSGDMPILMLTAKGEAGDRIKGFTVGTDDYLIKPFEPMELVMRVKALLRRYRISVSNSIQLGRILLDKQSYLVTFNDTGAETSLPLKEFELLYIMASYPGQLFTREMLISQIWGYEYEGDERTVDTHIKRLRERFADYQDDFKIATLRGLGYRLEVGHD